MRRFSLHWDSQIVTCTHHEWLDPDADIEVERLLREFDIATADLPVVIATGTVLRRPTPDALADYLGLTIGSLPDRCFDLIVVGAGPAGLAEGSFAAGPLPDRSARAILGGSPGSWTGRAASRTMAMMISGVTKSSRRAIAV